MIQHFPTISERTERVSLPWLSLSNSRNTDDYLVSTTDTTFQEEYVMKYICLVYVDELFLCTLPESVGEGLSVEWFEYCGGGR